MRPLLNVHVANTLNIGDLVCAPALYFRGLRARIVDIERLAAVRDLPGCDVILGGGGLFGNAYFDEFLATLSADPRTRIAVWGAGTNTHDTDAVAYPPLLDRIGPVGVRDWDCGREWVPCASCMSPEFDRPRKIRHEAVIYEHARFPIAIEGLPRQQNFRRRFWHTFRRTLDFIGSGETVITSSYHGAYWGVLLGRKVVAVPYANKFGTLKYPFAVCEGSDWSAAAARAETHPGALRECRETNVRFAQRVGEYFATTP